jgi:hypothetical protein
MVQRLNKLNKIKDVYLIDNKIYLLVNNYRKLLENKKE